MCWVLCVDGRTGWWPLCPPRGGARGRRGSLGFPIFAAGLCLLLACCPAAAGAKRRPSDPAPGGDEPYTQQQLRQARAWSAFYAGRHAEAVKLAAALGGSQYPSVRAEANHCRARSLWAAGDKAEARRLWQALAGSTLTSAIRRQAIARAVLLDPDADRAKLPAATAALEAERKRPPKTTCTAEAALELARLYVAARRFDDAQRVLSCAREYLAETAKLEITAAVAAPFVQAAKDALKKLACQRDAGRAEFEQAERLRRDRKFKEAAAAYRAVIRDFPDTDYAPRADLHIGDCIEGLGGQGSPIPLRRDRSPHLAAVAHWRRFIASSPPGPWRGQAYAGILRIYLEELPNLAEAGRQSQMAQVALPRGLADRAAGPSWQAAAFDLHLQGGIIACLRGDRAAAATAWQRARDAADKVPAGLAALIAAARDDLPIIPADVAVAAATDRATLALSLGVIYHLCGRGDRARRLIGLVAGAGDGKGRSGTRAQVAFARFCQARMQPARPGSSAEHPGYADSLRLWRGGSWQDEVLCRLAAGIERRAAAAAAARKEAPGGALLRSRARALPIWQELIGRYPDSPYLDPAAYHVGVWYFESEKWDDAFEKLAAFVAKYPASCWAGDACVRLMDAALERRLDLAEARTCAARAVEWARDPAKRPAGRRQAPVRYAFQAPVCRACPPPDGRAAEHTLYDLGLRAGIVACLDGRYDDAVALLGRAGPVARPGSFQLRVDLDRLGLDLLIGAAKAGRAPTADAAIDAAGSDPQRLGVRLADLYLQALRPDRAAALYERILRGEPVFGRTPDAFRAYCLLQLGRACARQPSRAREGLSRLAELYGPRYAACSWTPDGLLRLGVFTYNVTQNAAQAMPHYRHVFTAYPDHPAAERAMYYYCRHAVRTGRADLARRTARDFLHRYPASPRRAAVEAMLAEAKPPPK